MPKDETQIYMSRGQIKKKSFDSLPHSWIAKSLQMLGISNNIRQFLKVAMNSWSTSLSVNYQILGQVRIQREIFQGDSLNPLLFVAALDPPGNHT